MTEPTDTAFGLAGKKIWVAGHRGMVGSALVRRLASEGGEVVTVDRSRVDLRRQGEVEEWMAETRPQAVVVAAATVGGIHANDTRPAEFIYDNLMIEGNVIEGAYRTGVEKLLFLGSSCIYPKLAPQPMAEDALLTGALEPTNQWYAVAKIAGIKLCQAYRRQHGSDFISAMPSNLYGPGDNFDLMSSHVVPALIAKVHAAKLAGTSEIEVWGTGEPRREFLYVEDLADAIVHLLKCYSGAEHVNVGTGYDVRIAELVDLTCQVIGYEGGRRYNTEMPDGAPRKLLDVARLAALGWRAKTELRDGLAATYDWYTRVHAAA